MSKPLQLLWSKAALEFAGDDLVALGDQLRHEVSGIVAKTHSWFAHVVTREGESSEHMLFVRGQEEDDVWTVFVQLGEFRDVLVGPDEEPLPEILGMKPSMPSAVEGRENEQFYKLERQQS